MKREKLFSLRREQWWKINSKGKFRPYHNYLGGYRLLPILIEFWRGGPARLHERLRYRMSDRGWELERLAP